MNITKLEVDPAGAFVELFDGLASRYKFRIGAAVEAVEIPGAFAAYKFLPHENASPLILWAPRIVAPEIPVGYSLPSSKPIPDGLAYLHLDGCRQDEWFIKLLLQIRRNIA